MLEQSPSKLSPVGGLEWHDAGATLPDGPKNLCEDMETPRAVFRTLFDPRTPGGKDLQLPT